MLLRLICFWKARESLLRPMQNKPQLAGNSGKEVEKGKKL
jgi:hypothetical protein